MRFILATLVLLSKILHYCPSFCQNSNWITMISHSQLQCWLIPLPTNANEITKGMKTAAFEWKEKSVMTWIQSKSTSLHDKVDHHNRTFICCLLTRVFLKYHHYHHHRMPSIGFLGKMFLTLLLLLISLSFSEGNNSSVTSSSSGKRKFGKDRVQIFLSKLFYPQNSSIIDYGFWIMHFLCFAEQFLPTLFEILMCITSLCFLPFWLPHRWCQECSVRKEGQWHHQRLHQRHVKRSSQ